MDVLVVDDDPVSRRLIGAMLQRLGHRGVMAEGGVQAWEIWRQHHHRVVISDWQMAEVDGLELLRRIRADDDGSRYTWFVLLTAHHAPEQIEQAIAAGVDDHLSKPVARLEISSRLATASRILGLQQTLAERNAQLTEANHRHRQDVASAAAATRALLPQAGLFEPGWEMAWRNDSCEALGGDLLGFRRAGDGALCCWLFDVSGHGVAAGLMAVQVDRELVHTLSRGVSAPTELALTLAKAFHRTNDLRYLTLIYARLDPMSGRCELLSAGHPSPLLALADGSVERIDVHAHPIGLVPPDLCRFHTWTWDLHPGDRLLLVSDGLVEESSPTDEVFGIERLIEAVQACHDLAPSATCDAIHARLVSWRGGVPPMDDETMLLISRTGVAR